MEFKNALKEMYESSNEIVNNYDELLQEYQSLYKETADDEIQEQELEFIFEALKKKSVNIYYMLSNAIKHDVEANSAEYSQTSSAVEKLSKIFDESNISKISYSYYLSSFLELALENENGEIEGLEKVSWTSPNEYESVDDNSLFEIEGDTLVKYLGANSYVVIPNAIKVIGEGAFENNKSLKIVYFSNNIDTICDSAFANAVNLKMVVLSDKITIIPNNCFKGCSKLSNINLNNIKIAYSGAFDGCKALSDVNLDNLIAVGNYTFRFCYSLKDYSFISNLQAIGNYAFEKCSIKNIDLKSCMNLGNYAFAHCRKLNSIIIENDMEIGLKPFNKCVNVSKLKIVEKFDYSVRGLFEDDIDTFNNEYKMLDTISVAYLHDSMFTDFANVKNIIVTADTKIYKSSFENCTSLEEVKFYEEVNKLESCAFKNCQSINAIDITYTGYCLEADTFYNCNNMTDWSIIDNVKVFGTRCMGRTNLTNFNFDREFKSIGLYAFSNSIFKDNLSLNLVGTKLYSCAFLGIKNIDKLVVGKKEDLVSNYIYTIFDKDINQFNSKVTINTLVLQDNIYINAFENYEAIKNIIFNSDGVIPNGAFKNATGFETIKANGNINTIGNEAFAGCTNLVKLDIQIEALEIMDSAFNGCSSLGNTFDLSKVTSIGEYAFANTKLENVILNENTKYIGFGAFNNVNTITSMTLPFAGDGKYDTEGAKLFGYIFGNGESTNLQVSPFVETNTYFIPENLTEVTILSSKVDDKAFDNIIGIKVVNLPNITEFIKPYFTGTETLEELHIGKSLEKFLGYSLINCNNASITIDDECKSYKIKSRSVYSKDEKALYYFNDHNDETNINDLLASIEEVKKFSIYNVNSKELVIPSNIKLLEGYAIRCINVESITIDNVANVEQKSLYGSNKLMNITLKGNPYIGSIDLINKEDVSLNSFTAMNFKDAFAYKIVFNDFNGNINMLKSSLIGVNLYNNAFDNVESITDLNISLTPINKGIFGNCDITNLRINGLVNDPIKYLYTGTNYQNLNRISLDNTPIKSGMLANIRLEHMIIKNSSSIAANAFMYFKSNSLYLENIDNIEPLAFRLSDISNCNVKDDNYYVDETNTIRSKDTIVYSFNKELEEYTLTDDVTRVYAGSFDGNTTISHVDFGKNKIVVDNNAFVGCTNLSKVDLYDIEIDSLSAITDNPDSISEISYLNESIRANYLSNLANVRKITLNENLEEVGEYAFSNDENLEDFINVEKAKVFGDYAFNNCKKLGNLTINNTLLGKKAFAGCNNLLSVEYVIDDNQIENGYTLNDLFDLEIYEETYPDIYVYAKEIPNSYFKEYKGKIYVQNVPSKIGDYAFYKCGILADFGLDKVSIIGDYAFYESEMTELDLVEIESIGDYGFAGCKNLSKVRLGKKCVHLGKNWIDGTQVSELTVDEENDSFTYVANCLVSKLDKSLVFCAPGGTDEYIDLANKIEVVSSGVFTNLENVIEIDLRGVKEIYHDAFVNCPNLEKVTFDESLEYIDTNLFESCDSIEELTISKLEFADGTTNLKNLFKNESGNYLPQTLKTLNVLSGVLNSDNLDEINNIESMTLPNITIIPDNYFAKTNNILNVNIPSSVEIIGESAFEGCTNLTYIDLNVTPNLKSIKARAFANTGLTEMIITESVSELGFDILSGCKLKEITINACIDNLELSKILGNGSDATLTKATIKAGTLKSYCFQNLIALEEVSLPDVMEMLPEGCFSECHSLYKLSGVSKVMRLGPKVFENCYALVDDSIRQMRSLLDIGDYSFAGCKGLTKFTMSGYAYKIGVEVFKDCTGINTLSVPFIGPNEYTFDTIEYLIKEKNNIKKITLLNGEVPDNCFAGMLGLETVVLMSSVKKIGSHAFDGCKNLKSVEDATGIKEIKDASFKNCIGLTQLSFESLSSVGKYAFDGCSSLKDINLGGVESIGDYAFRGCKAFKEIALPLTAEKIGRYIFNGCENIKLIDVPYALGTPNVSMSLSYYFEAVPSTLEAINIRQGTPGKGYFAGCKYIKEVFLPGNIKTLEEEVFMDCTGLEVVHGIKNVSEIKNSAFAGCESLKKFSGELSNADKIGNNAFLGCKQLLSIRLKKISSLGDAAFMDCTGLTHVEIGEQLKALPNRCFENTGLSDISLPKKLSGIGSYAFAYCPMDKFTVPMGITEMGEFVFFGIKKIKVYIKSKELVKHWDKKWKYTKKFHLFGGKASVKLI